ncbi:DNA-binding response regulator [Guyparkeria sp. SCN-R1]|uniref:helix-turn-helix domain-containing protein n=1 Tax=Guyparkeria sp. SCN-R1 TaxID=2341113 RepID=UPI000F64618A|nr:DNA-binding response regulator [Guyparkeria sp. SCN-R1]
MLTQKNAMEIRALGRQGMGIKEIARKLGVSRKTVRTNLRNGVPAAFGPREPRPTKVDPFKGHR